MLFPAFNKEKIELLQRFLEAQEREEKEKNDLQVAPGRRSLRCLRHSAGRRSKAQGCQPLAPGRRDTAHGAGARKKVYKLDFFVTIRITEFYGEELFFGGDSEVLKIDFKCGNSFQSYL
ncbi:hypothetical protein QL285_012825 [Trifolium repens]|nr:hypothetical protein QL285_012825 [Trifolium repens]